MTENTLERLEQEIPALRRFARALVGHPERADDLVQDTLERALTRLDSYTPGTNMRAWLFTILRNAHINELRRARTTTAPDETLEALSPPAPAGQEHGLAMRDLQRALAQLTPEMREVLLLIGLEGLSYEEAATVLCAKVGTVKSRLCRGREALRRLMDGELKQLDGGPHPAELLIFPRIQAALERRNSAPPITAAERRRAAG
ncbi:sigma-70 family RNA polymerase sigma factor [Arenibaculum sp.]|jgi:RNA polymerase sigma-70 factor (ECF subfamily)|uniref:sigma-70 family RNA polymerase sigma factor n=1 Tax=Arenibaculum sp. TaxID=2865862 RepID=UPI002E167B0D|nr:sigma-70 family RNA polymerase sigma factor [Arenibaculum sp.]